MIASAWSTGWRSGLGRNGNDPAGWRRLVNAHVVAGSQERKRARLWAEARRNSHGDTHARSASSAHWLQVWDWTWRPANSAVQCIIGVGVSPS